MLKIGLVSPFPPEEDGIAIYSDNILRGLRKKASQIVTIGRKPGSDYVLDFRSINLNKALSSVIRREKLDVLHFQYVAPFYSKVFLNLNLVKALKQKIPVVVTLHEVHYDHTSFKDKVLGLIEKLIVNGADQIIVHTPKQKKFLEKKYKAKNIKVIYHGLRLNKVPKRNKKNKLLFLGFISKGKGLSVLIKAMKQLPNCQLTIAGKFVDDKIKKEITNEMRKSKSNIHTHFGWVTEQNKEKFYKDADVVILPHVWAPYQSGILHNAISWGLPVVASDAGALPEMVREFQLGEVVKAGSPSSLAKGINTTLKNYKLYLKGINRYRDCANWGKIAQDHLHLYQKIAK